jgi:ABC-type branched-subunit amino acid transport system ATPase component/ABC-type branched-subunit amino acid transport system permease subunit
MKAHGEKIMVTNVREQNQAGWHKYLPIICVFVGAALISYLLGEHRYLQRILLLVLLWAATSNCFNIITGYGGQTVFGYMLFVGTGAYTTVLLFKFFGVSPWLGMWIGSFLAAFFAFFIGLPTLRLHGVYFAITTVAFPLIAIPIVNYLGFEEVTIPFAGHGPGSMQFTDLRYYALIAAIFLVLTLIIIKKMEGSRFGFSLRALQKNETAAEAMGIDTYTLKMEAFLLSAALGAIAGTIYAFGVLYTLTTGAVGVFIIVRPLAITIVGGLGTLWGPVIGAVLLVPLGEFLNAQLGARYPGVQDIVYGLALIVAILFMPEGIWVKIRGAIGNSRKKSAYSPELVTAEDSEQNIAEKNTGTQGTFKSEPVQTRITESNNNEPILKIEGVNKFFGGVSALSDVAIEVPRGGILGIIGPNGAGKTTLYNVINGYLRPEKGKVFFEGEDVTHFKPHDLCRLGIGRTFQIAQIFGNMTVLENIMIGAFNRERDVVKARAIAEKVAQQMGLSRRAYDRAVGLTIWEIKTLEFARAIATKPKLLLVDEPMAGLNPEEANHLGEIIRAIANRGITVIVIEHLVQNLVDISDRMVGLDNGRKVAEGTPQEVTSASQIVEAYLGAKWRERYAKC